MKEIWKDIKNYEGLYQVSNLGNVRSLFRYKKTLKLCLNKHNGYMYIYLCKNKKSKSYRVHRLVAETFISNEYDKPYVNHKDGNKTNNNINNLEWCTAKENTIHAIKNGLLKIKKGKENHMYGRYSVKNNNSKKVNQYDLNNNFIKKWDCIMDIERFFNKKNINSSIVACCKGKQQTAYGYIWKYTKEEE